MAKVTGKSTRATGAILASHGKPANYPRQSAWLAKRTTKKSGPKA